MDTSVSRYQYLVRAPKKTERGSGGGAFEIKVCLTFNRPAKTLRGC